MSFSLSSINMNRTGTTFQYSGGYGLPNRLVDGTTRKINKYGRHPKCSLCFLLGNRYKRRLFNEHIISSPFSCPFRDLKMLGWHHHPMFLGLF